MGAGGGRPGSATGNDPGALQRSRSNGSDLAIYSFPATDHGMVEFTETADGSRSYTRVTEGYFRLIADWINGAL